jgi:hypothetical protein
MHWWTGMLLHKFTTKESGQLSRLIPKIDNMGIYHKLVDINYGMIKYYFFDNRMIY